MMRAAAIVLVLLTVASAGWAQAAGTQQAESSSQPQDLFRQSLQALVAYSPDPCGPPFDNEADWDTSNIEAHLFNAAQNIVVDALNDSSLARTPKDRASTALKWLEDESARINAEWPEENRFRFEVLDIAPLLVVKMGVRSHERFFVFGISEGASGKNRNWSELGSDEEALVHPEVAHSSLSLSPLHRGPSGNARFLATFSSFGCAGSTGVAYDAREWSPKRFVGLTQIIKQSGVFGLDDKVPGFPQIGELKTEGLRVTLPYCWYSRIDTWDNPSLCAVDTYDLSGDNAKFFSRIYNRPDLLPVAKAIEYAGQRDYAALLGYCGSTQLAKSMIRDLPPYVYAGAEIHVSPMEKGRKHVELGEGPSYQFEVEKRNGRWVVVAFKVK